MKKLHFWWYTKLEKKMLYIDWYIIHNYIWYVYIYLYIPFCSKHRILKLKRKILEELCMHDGVAMQTNLVLCVSKMEVYIVLNFFSNSSFFKKQSLTFFFYKHLATLVAIRVYKALGPNECTLYNIASFVSIKNKTWFNLLYFKLLL